MELAIAPVCRAYGRNHSGLYLESPSFKSNYARVCFKFPGNCSAFPSSASVRYEVSPDCASGRRFVRSNCSADESVRSESQDKEVDNLGVRAALSTLKFYKREISPLLPRSCRYVPTCSEYSMIAYNKYGFVKGTILTAWRICRCNPLGGSGFDPPRWFDETPPPK